MPKYRVRCNNNIKKSIKLININILILAFAYNRQDIQKKRVINEN
jgi:hypothetical protein